MERYIRSETIRYDHGIWRLFQLFFHMLNAVETHVVLTATDLACSWMRNSQQKPGFFCFFPNWEKRALCTTITHALQSPYRDENQLLKTKTGLN